MGDIRYEKNWKSVEVTETEDVLFDRDGLEGMYWGDPCCLNGRFMRYKRLGMSIQVTRGDMDGVVYNYTNKLE